MRTAIILIMLMVAGSTNAHWGQWPENDQRQGQCEFSDWSRFAFVQSVYDGDTITVDFDMAFGMMWTGQKIRLYGVNAPEIRNKDPTDKARGFAARDWLRGEIDQKWIVITTIKDESGKYGRHLATLCRDGHELIDEMLVSGMLKRAEY